MSTATSLPFRLGPRTAQLAGALAIALAAGAAFAPALRGGWIWDDPIEVGGNLDLRDPAGLARIWLAPSGSDYFPLKSTLQWCEWQLWGGWTPGYHGVSLAFQVLNALLLWRLFSRLALPGGWLAGMLFAIHPLGVESVAWIAEQKNLFSLTFLLTSLLAYLRFDSQGDRRPLALALVLFTAGLLCKSSVAPFPVFLLAYVQWRRGRVARRDLLAIVPFLFISLILGLVTVWFQNVRAIGSWPVDLGGGWHRIARAAWITGFYFLKCFAPIKVQPVYPGWQAAGDLFAPLAALLALGLLGAAAVRFRHSWGRDAWLAAAWFGFFLAPVLGFVPMAYHRFSWVADHLGYLASIGPIALVAATLANWARTWPKLAALSGGMAVLLLGAKTYAYAGIFRNEGVFWTYALQSNPAAWVAEIGLGDISSQQGKFPEAISYYETALRAVPHYPELHNNLGNALRNNHRPDAAVDQYRAALALNPRYPEARYNLGNALIAAGELPEGIKQLQLALDERPDYPDARLSLGDGLSAAGDRAGALKNYETAIQLRPNFAEAHNNLGAALAESGRLPEAVREFQTAVALRPAWEDARINLEMAQRQLAEQPLK